MIGPVKLETFPTRRLALLSALKEALPARHVKGAWYRAFDDHTPQELADGVLMVISAVESGYRQGTPGRVARDGTQLFVLVGYLKADEDDPHEALQDAEDTLAEDLKSFARTPIPGMSLWLDRVETSRQLEHPYGWVLAFIEAGPPDSNIN